MAVATGTRTISDPINCSPPSTNPGDGYGSDVAQPCGILLCAPDRDWIPSGGTIKIQFSDNVPAALSEQWNRFKQAITFNQGKWNAQLRAWRMPNRIEVGSGGYTISVDSGMRGSGVWGNAVTPNTAVNSGTITINPETLETDNNSFYKFIAGQELGHILGIGHSGCSMTASIMASPVPGPTAGMAEEPQCSDILIFFVDRTQRSYGGGNLGGGGAGNPGGYEEGDCRHEQFGEWDDAKIEFCSPIVIDLDAGPFEMSAPDVWFNLTGRGPRWYGWTPARSAAVGWLALDRDGDGMITTGAELFGNFTPLSDTPTGPRASDGFEALAWFDQSTAGGNDDGWIDKNDAVYRRLLMWFDVNHDGISQRSELRSMTDTHVVAVSLRAYSSQRRDKYGNSIMLRSEARILMQNGKELRRPVYDVLLVVR